MEGIAENRELVINLAKLIDDHKGEGTVVLDLKGLNSWTDYFVITTVKSQAHQAGLIKAMIGFLDENKIETLNPYKSPTDFGWALIDCGFFVVHLMSKEKREFYELEKFWFKSEVIYQSSKSS